MKGADGNAILLDVDAMLESVGGTDLAGGVGGRDFAGVALLGDGKGRHGECWGGQCQNGNSCRWKEKSKAND